MSTAPRPSRTDHPSTSTGSDPAMEVMADPTPYTMQPIMKARLRPRIWPILPPVIMKAAMTRV